MKVDFLATERHFVDHLKSVYEALPSKYRGKFITEGNVLDSKGLWVVSSCGDYRKTSGDVIYFEHGCGLSYGNGHPSYAGGLGKDRVVLFCSTNDMVAEKNIETYPNIPNVIIGSPKMDSLSSIVKETGTKPVVALSFHWDCKVVPETRTSWDHYKKIIGALKRKTNNEYDFIGHGHPRIIDSLIPYYKYYGIKVVKNFEDVVKQADVYVCDNSSTIYEFAALDRPVVVLNSPFYRRDVSHGLRFWENIPGIMIDNPWELPNAIEECFNNDTYSSVRKEITSIVYPNIGSSSKLSVDAILKYIKVAPVGKDNGRG